LLIDVVAQQICDMSRLQPVFPLLKNNFNRRRSRTWQILGLIVLLFLTLTFLAVRYLPTVVIDPVSVLKNGDFKDIFVPPIPRPPVHWSGQDHNHSLHLLHEQSRLKEKIHRDQDHGNQVGNVDPKENAADPSAGKKDIEQLLTNDKSLSVEKLVATFSSMSIDELRQIKSNEMRREKVREVSHAFVFVLRREREREVRFDQIRRRSEREKSVR
jgi:hypothetical protein